MRHGERWVLNLFRALCLLLLASTASADPKCAPFGSDASGFKVTLAPTANLTQWAQNAALTTSRAGGAKANTPPRAGSILEVAVIYLRIG
jgi:hypothetical protein